LRRGELELPVVKLEILDFDVHIGGPSDPIFWEGVEEVGRGKGDGNVQKVLRKWWFGE
jgi:hypothetical protein